MPGMQMPTPQKPAAKKAVAKKPVVKKQLRRQGKPTPALKPSPQAPTKPDEAMKGMDQASIPGMDMAPPASATQSSHSMPNLDMQAHRQHGPPPHPPNPAIALPPTPP